MVKKGFGARLKELRESKGLTQKELGRRIGVHYLNVGKYEKDKVGPSVDTLMRMGRVFNVPLDFLVYGVAAKSHIEDEELFYLFKSILGLPPADRLEAKQLVRTFLEQKRGR